MAPSSNYIRSDDDDVEWYASSPVRGTNAGDSFGSQEGPPGVATQEQLEYQAMERRLDFHGEFRVDGDTATGKLSHGLRHIQGDVLASNDEHRKRWEATAAEIKCDAASGSHRISAKQLSEFLKAAQSLVFKVAVTASNTQQRGAVCIRAHEDWPEWEPSPEQMFACWWLARDTARQRARKALLRAVDNHTSLNRANVAHSVQTKLLHHAVRLTFPYNPRAQQVEAIRVLLFDQADLILVARTSFGKSTILQAFSLITPRTTLVILPLNQIGKEQEAKIRALGGRPLAIDAERRSQLSVTELAALRDGDFTHLMISPEAALSPWFQDMMASPTFQKKLGLVVIDEFHLANQWGESFRKQYAMLHYLRGGMSSRVPWFACSATLDEATLTEARIAAGFRTSTQVLRTPIDRPEIFLQVATIPEHTLHSYDALFHILDNASGRNGSPLTPHLVDKTVVYMDVRADCALAAESMKDRLFKESGGAYTTAQLDRMIRVYHGKTGKTTQKRILREFAKLGDDSEVRIIIATEALGLGVDLPDVRRVYQYRMPRAEHLATLWQRAGRAARGEGLRGTFTLLIEPGKAGRPPGIEEAEPMSQYTTLTNRRVSQLQQESQGPAKASKKGKGKAVPKQKATPYAPRNASQEDAFQTAKAERAAKERKSVTSLVTRRFAWTEACRRRVITDFIGHPSVEEPRSDLPCCDNCTKTFLKLDGIAPDPASKFQERTLLPFVVYELRQWEWNQAKRMYYGTVFPAIPGSLYSETLLRALGAEVVSSPCEVGSKAMLASWLQAREHFERTEVEYEVFWNVVVGAKERALAAYAERRILSQTQKKPARIRKRQPAATPALPSQATPSQPVSPARTNYFSESATEPDSPGVRSPPAKRRSPPKRKSPPRELSESATEPDIPSVRSTPAKRRPPPKRAPLAELDANAQIAPSSPKQGRPPKVRPASTPPPPPASRRYESASGRIRFRSQLYMDAHEPLPGSPVNK